MPQKMPSSTSQKSNNIPKPTIIDTQEEDDDTFPCFSGEQKLMSISKKILSNIINLCVY